MVLSKTCCQQKADIYAIYRFTRYIVNSSIGNVSEISESDNIYPRPPAVQLRSGFMLFRTKCVMDS